MFRLLENLFFPTSAVHRASNRLNGTRLLTAREKSLTENENDHFSSLKKTFKTSATKL